MTDERVGTVLQERYRVVRLLGAGGMGAVYEGEHLLLGRRVAIKFLHASMNEDPGAVARFLREAKAATAIRHKHIVEVTDMGQAEDGSLYIVLEFLEGRDWGEDIAATGAQPVSRVLHILAQVCDALTAAHAANIVHRDLKPENIFLLERDGDPDFVKVVDFGISKVLNADLTMTKSGAVLGTPYYMSPEQARDSKSVDARADLYSLGVILYQALTHSYPFEGQSYGDLIVKICVEPPPSLLAKRPDVPPALASLVERLLAKDPAGRPQSARELRDALRSIVHNISARDELGSAPTMMSLAPDTPQSRQHSSSPSGLHSSSQSAQHSTSQPSRSVAVAMPTPAPSPAPTAAGATRGWLSIALPLALGGALAAGVMALWSSGVFTIDSIDSIEAPVASTLEEEPTSEAPDSPEEGTADETSAQPDPATVYRFELPERLPQLGPDDALVTIVEFGDFECQFCGRVSATMDRIRREYGDDVRIVWMNNPLDFHPNAFPAATAALEAFDQGGNDRFWAMHGKLFENQSALTRGDLESYAQQIDLDAAQFRAALDNDEHGDVIDRQQALARRFGATSTPSFFVNGRHILGAQPFPRFKAVIDQELARARELVAAGTPRAQIYAAAVGDGATGDSVARPTEMAPRVGAPGPAPPPANGTLRVSSRPSAEILIDGQTTGSWTPVSALEVVTGTHVLGLRTRDGTLHEQSIEVVAGERLSLVHSLGARATMRAAVRGSDPPMAMGRTEAAATMRLSATAVRTVFMGRRSALQRCATTHQVHGRAELVLRIAASGRVDSADVRNSTFDDRQATACILQVVNAFRFPASTEGLSVTFPITFR